MGDVASRACPVSVIRCCHQTFRWRLTCVSLGVIGVLEIIVGIGAAVFFFGGIYSVAGTAEDPAISVMR